MNYVGIAIFKIITVQIIYSLFGSFICRKSAKMSKIGKSRKQPNKNWGFLMASEIFRTYQAKPIEWSMQNISLAVCFQPLFYFQYDKSRFVFSFYCFSGTLNRKFYIKFFESGNYLNTCEWVCRNFQCEFHTVWL